MKSESVHLDLVRGVVKTGLLGGWSVPTHHPVVFLHSLEGSSLQLRCCLSGRLP